MHVGHKEIKKEQVLGLGGEFLCNVVSAFTVAKLLTAATPVGAVAAVFGAAAGEILLRKGLTKAAGYVREAKGHFNDLKPGVPRFDRLPGVGRPVAAPA